MVFLTSILPGTQDYYDAIERGIIKDEVAHLNWLASERSIEEDVDHPEFVKVADKVSKEDLKRAYHIVNTLIEQRPYDYSTPANVFLEKDNRIIFDKRPLARK